MQQITYDTIRGLTVEQGMRMLFGPGVNSTNRMEVLSAILSLSPREVAHELFPRAYSGCDDTWYYRRDLLIDLRNQVRPGVPLGEGAEEFLRDLPNPLTVYRGCHSTRVRGLSWTTDCKVAEGFARGHRGIRVPDAVVASAQIPKEAIFMVCLGRQESEVVLDPRRLRRLVVEPFTPQAMAEQ